MSTILRRQVPLAIASIIILIVFLEYYIAYAPLKTLSSAIQQWAIICATLAVGVGVINAALIKIDKIKKKQPYWYFDAWMLIVFVIFVVTGFMGKTYGEHPIFQWMMQYVYLPVDSTIFALVAFDIVAAFYRSFRVRTGSSIILLVSALIIMLWNMPMVGGLWPGFMPLGSWVLDVPAAGVGRGITIITAIGLVGFSIRELFMKERTVVGVVD